MEITPRNWYNTILLIIQEGTAVTLAVKPNQIKLLVGSAGILGLALRAVLYANGVDQKGLLISGYWAGNAIWCLTAVVAVVLLLLCRRLNGTQDCEKAFPASALGAAGSALAGIAFLLSPVAQTPSQAFGTIEPVLRYASAGALIFISYCRFRSKAPQFLLHGIVCLYLALRLVCQYRLWSADPQIQNYAFYLGAHVALMLTAYQFAAFDAGFGSHQKLWGAGLAGIYLATLSLVPVKESFFLICCVLWIVTNLSHPQTGKDAAPTENHPNQEDLP